jgi:hypothetical protein
MGKRCQRWDITSGGEMEQACIHFANISTGLKKAVLKEESGGELKKAVF